MSTLGPWLLVIEDSDEDWEALRRALLRARCSPRSERVASASQGRAALQRALERRALPSLLLLDLNLAGEDGRDLLLWLRADPHLAAIPVVVLTTSSDPQDVAACYRAGAASYLVKPVDFHHFNRSIAQLCSYWFQTVLLPGLEGTEP